MENTPIEAAGAAPAPQTEATPITNTQPETPAVDLHGFTEEQLADMRKFYDANGGYDKVKSRISNPVVEQPAQRPEPAQTTAPVETPLEPQAPAYKAPQGSITAQEFLAQQYFGALSREEKYASIAKEVESGEVLKDMAAFNIRPINQDGTINDAMVRRYLDLKAQTVVAKQTAVAPEASTAPTVDYVPYNEQVTDMRQAMAVLQQDSQLKSAGMKGHPAAEAAEKFMREQLNPGRK